MIQIVAAFPSDNVDGPTPEYDINPVGVRGMGYHIGRAHEKWVPCLDPITIQQSGPLVCLICPPPPSTPPTPPLLPQESFPPGTSHRTSPDRKPDRWIISRFNPSEWHRLYPIHLPHLKTQCLPRILRSHLHLYPGQPPHRRRRDNEIEPHRVDDLVQ